MIKNIIKHIQNGFENVNQETFNSRIEICHSCEFFESSTVRCKNCGCFLNIKAKWASEKCPLDKWQAVELKQINTSNGDCGCGKKNV